MRKIKRSLLLVLTILLLIIGFVTFQKYLAPTKIGLINYPDFLFTKIAKSSDNSFIRVTNLHPDSLPSLVSYDMLLVFGMGIKINDSEKQKIIDAGEKGTKIYLHAATNPNLQLTNIHGKHLDYISDYLDNAGKKNFSNLLNYIRRQIDRKKLFSDTITSPQKIASDVLFYKDEEASFEQVSEFEKYCIDNHYHKKNAKKVILFTSMPGPFNTNRDHINSLIDELSRRQLNVYPVAGFRGRLKYMQEINPSLIVYMPHGRLSMGGSAEAINEWLKKQNVPVLCPVSVFQEYDQWLKNKQGMFGGLLSQTVTMPEFDGGILPYAVFAQYKDKQGYLLFKAIPDRLKKFGDIAENYIGLREIKNETKKIALVYFKGPGKNALVAANMEVLPSIHNLLLRLKKEGYNLGDLPDDYKSFEQIVNQKGPVLGPYAKGAYEQFVKQGDPELIPVEKYEKWCADVLPKENYDEVVKRYGKAPGAYMSVYKDGADFLAIARVKFGNVVLLPQPLPGIGENEFMLIHGAKVAPPHAYISPYLWIQKDFKADAIFHFGTHGSLEFTPGKQIALSAYDWTDPLIGTTPHFYVYTISNIGEAMIAKRRSYATTQTYLTPPFIEAQAFGDKKLLREKIHKYEQAKGALKREYAFSVKKMAVEEGIHKDLDLDSVLDEPYSKEEMLKLANYLEEIEYEKIPGGLYTMGTPYTKEKLDETISLMFLDPLAYNLAEIDQVKGHVTEEQLKNKIFFNNNYVHPAKKYIDEILRTGKTDALFKQIVTSDDYKRAVSSKKRIEKKQHEYPKGIKAHPHKKDEDKVILDTDRKKLRNLIVCISSDADKKVFIKKLESDKEYEKAISLLDPQKKAKALRMAKMIPAMAKALDIVQDSTVHEIIQLIQHPELRTLALEYINDNGLEEEIAREKERQERMLLRKALTPPFFSILDLREQDLQQFKLNSLDSLNFKLCFFSKNKNNLLSVLEKAKDDEQVRLKIYLENHFPQIKEMVDKRIAKLSNTEDAFANAVFKVKETLNSIIKKREQLHSSPQHEMLAILNSMNGGFTAPSSGGDPISNPQTIPTGRNLYAINAEQTPSKEAWKVGKKLAASIITDYRSKHEDNYPKKISFTLWAGSFIETEGTTIAQILYFLGVEPIWDSFGKVKNLRLIPADKLGRPRIDVVVQTSGQLRDLAASRLFLINQAIEIAAAANEEQQNFVNQGVKDAEKLLIQKGFSPKHARELSFQRVFGGVNGNYSTGIMDMVENSGRWDSTRSVAQAYINNMGAVYGASEDWGSFNKGVFEAALLNTEAVVQPRQSNTWGALSLDHVYEFMGGINLAVKEVTGNDAESYFNDFRNSSNPRVQGLKEAVWVESHTTLLNPRYIKEYMKGGASSAETFAETFRNTFGWNVMKPSIIENRLWDKLYDVYVQDELNLDIHHFFQKENPYALQEMTAIMLETVRKGFWKASPEQIAAIAELHAQLVKDHEAGCSGFVCDNQKLQAFISKQLQDELNDQYSKQIENIRESQKDKNNESVVLKKQEKIQPEQDKNSFHTNPWPIGILVCSLLFALILFIMKRRK